MNQTRRAALNRIAALVGAIGRELEALRDDERDEHNALYKWEEAERDQAERDWTEEIDALLGEALDFLRNAKTAIDMIGEVKP